MEEVQATLAGMVLRENELKEQIKEAKLWGTSGQGTIHGTEGSHSKTSQETNQRGEGNARKGCKHHYQRLKRLWGL